MIKHILIALIATGTCGMVLAADKNPTTKPSAKVATSQPVQVDITKPTEIDAAIDHDVIIVGTVDTAKWTKSGKTLLIKFKDAPDDFRATSYQKQKEDLDKKFAGDAEKNLPGKKVEVTGKIRRYNGSVASWNGVIEIPVTKASQIKVVSAKG